MDLGLLDPRLGRYKSKLLRSTAQCGWFRPCCLGSCRLNLNLPPHDNRSVIFLVPTSDTTNAAPQIKPSSLGSHQVTLPALGATPSPTKVLVLFFGRLPPWLYAQTRVAILGCNPSSCLAVPPTDRPAAEIFQMRSRTGDNRSYLLSQGFVQLDAGLLRKGLRGVKRQRVSVPFAS